MHIREPALIAAGAHHSVGIAGLSVDRLTHEGPPGVIVGYGNVSEPAIGRESA
jgi:hypothetical protein